MYLTSEKHHIIHQVPEDAWSFSSCTIQSSSGGSSC